MTLPTAPVVAAIQPGLGGAAFLNSAIAQPMSFLLDKVAVRARCTTSTGFATGGVATPWASVDEDPYGMWGPSQPSPLANSVFVAQQPGWYGIDATVTLTGTGTASSVLIPRLQVNGACPLVAAGGSWEGSEIPAPVTSGQPQAATGYWEAYCNAGDQIVVQTYLSATSSQTWNTTVGQESRLSILWRATV